MVIYVTIRFHTEEEMVSCKILQMTREEYWRPYLVIWKDNKKPFEDVQLILHPKNCGQ